MAAMRETPAEEASYDEVLRRVVRRDLRGYRGRSLALRTYDLDTTLYRDVIDLFLWCSGSRDAVWIDRLSREERARSFLPSGARVFSELVFHGPRAYCLQRRAVARIEGGNVSVRPVRNIHRGLYIRSDHMFDTQAGGSVGHIAGVIEGFRRHGVDLQVISTDTLRLVPIDERFHLARPVYDRVRNIPELPRLMHNTALLERIAEKWDQWRPDFVYGRYSMHGYTGPALRSRYQVPYVCEYNGSFVWMNRHWVQRRFGPRGMFFERLGERIEMLNLRAADLVVVVSRAMKEEVVARGIDAGKVLVNPNGVDPDRYHPEVDGTAVRRRYRLEGGLVVGFIGTFGPWHGAEKLVEAAASLVREHGDIAAKVRFLLIGDGQRMGAVRQLIEEHGLQDRVVLTGRVPQEEGPAHLAACDILASPHVPNPDGTPFFGSPTKLFEYMAMGRAIVASDLDQIGEVLEHGRTGWLVEPGNADALARGIAHLCREADLRRRLAVAARREAEERHSWDSHTGRILEALKERLADGATVGPTG